MLQDTLKKIYKIQSKKNDWVYVMWTKAFYVIHNKQLVAYCEYDWPNYWIYQIAYWFSSKVWEIVNYYDIKDKLKEWLELYKS